MARQPAVVPAFVGAEVIQNDVDLLTWIKPHDLVHEVQEFNPAPAPDVLGGHFAGQDIEGGKQSGGAIRWYSGLKPVTARPLGSLR